MGNIMSGCVKIRLVSEPKPDYEKTKKQSYSVVMAQEDAIVTASTGSLEVMVLEECTPSKAVSPSTLTAKNKAAAATMLSADMPSSPYLSERIDRLSKQRGNFANDVDFDIMCSRSHWTEPSCSTSDSECGLERVSNSEAFERLKEDPEWGTFFRRSWYDLVIGEKIAEGGQAEIFAASGTGWRDGKKIDLVVKVFKEGYFLRDLQRQWPPGLAQATLPNRYFNAGSYTFLYSKLCWAVDVQLLKDDRFAFVFERHWGDLRKLIDERMVLSCNTAPPFRFKTTLQILLEIAEGMASLHKFGLLHRDLKASNVLVVGNGASYVDKGDINKSFYPKTSVLVADFESSVGIAGTGFWRAPEVLREVRLAADNKRRVKEEVFTHQSDVYSYAMTCFEVITGCVPFDGHRSNDYDFVLGGGRPTLPDDTSPTLVDLVHRCWHDDPLQRPVFTTIVQALRDLWSGGSLYESWVYVSPDNEVVPSDLRQLLDRRIREHIEEGHNFVLFTLEEMLRLMVQIAKGMRDLHRKGILHTDLKSSHIKLDNVQEYSRHVFECKSIRIVRAEPSEGVVDTGLWRAPEVLLAVRKGTLKPGVFTKQSDVFSYAMTCYEVITGEVPFGCHQPSQSDHDRVLRGERPALPHWLPAPVTNVISQCWHSDPSQRPSFEVITSKLDRLSYWCKVEVLHFMVRADGLSEDAMSRGS
ncbi:hypothetical protein KC19_2G198800 [Ceratodon purpureus]|uniref:Protein kinase domain-containing protein n=1 Tax=Ceratodon purpureus TaxID=3225 RepID=A0A8T0IVY9_CERPU|nr:hypothetical protein KC19_2G198800 [Ceratodon purpureus]